MTRNTTRALSTRLASAYNALHAAGLFDYGGDVSLRLEDGRFLIRAARVHMGPESARSKVTTSAADMLIVSSDGSVVGGDGTPPLELATHVALFRARPELRSIVHAHARMATVVSMVSDTIMPCHTRGVETTSGDELAYLDRADGISTPELAEMLVAAMGKRHGALLHSHGIVTAGTTLEWACNAAINLEDAALMYWLAKQIGNPTPLPEDSLARRRATWAHPAFSSSVWRYHEEIGERSANELAGLRKANPRAGQ